MRRGLLGVLLLAAPAHGQPTLLKRGARLSDQPITRPAEIAPERAPRRFDPRIPSTSRLLVQAEDAWHVPPWSKPELTRIAPAKARIKLAPANLSGGRGIKIKIPI